MNEHEIRARLEAEYNRRLAEAYRQFKAELLEADMETAVAYEQAYREITSLSQTVKQLRRRIKELEDRLAMYEIGRE